MDGVLGILGVIALMAGAALCLAGFAGLGAFNVYQGVALLGSGIGMLAFSEVIKTLKEIRDRLPAPE